MGAALLCAALVARPCPAWAEAVPAREPATRPIEAVAFQDASIFFAPDSVALFANSAYRAADNGRLAATRVVLPELDGRFRIEAKVTVRPVPLDERSVHDRWDRAGNLRLLVPGAPDLEIARFMTAYGGRTEWTFDASNFAPLLRGRREVACFIDTWAHPAWTVDVAFAVTPDTTRDLPAWAAPLYYNESWNAEKNAGGEEVSIDVPAGLKRVILVYTSTGHCTDGRDEDEFVSKANVISVDGVVVERFHPWRTDCGENRALNPYCSRWTDGSWSSDYKRSGWCPGREVIPREINLTDQLTAGPHRVRFMIENMRPKDADGNFGYWRVSASLVGWDHPPALWKN